MTATWDDLMNWRPPSTATADDTPFVPHNVSDDLWVTERFTKTYLSEWSVPALRSEWRYLHGQKLAPCDPFEMRVREVSANDLARVMADRLRADPHPSEELTNMLVKPAVTFLEEGRRTEAAALFEAALRYDPNSADALNNLGFCLLPDDPEQALRHLDAAMGTGQANIEVTNANRLLALILLGRWTSAGDLAESHLKSILCYMTPTQRSLTVMTSAATSKHYATWPRPRLARTPRPPVSSSSTPLAVPRSSDTNFSL